MDKINDIQSSDRLLTFYKKLVETDAAIRNLRKYADGNSHLKVTESYDAEFNSAYSDRIKRSLNLFHRPRLFNFKKKRYPTTKPTVVNGKINSQTYVNVTKNKNKKPGRNKRDEDSNSQGLVIEKDTVFIQYRNPRNRIVAKCSHAPKEQKSHEKQLKHPFYKHSQRLDELLDQFWDRRLPDMIFDKFDNNNMPNKNTFYNEAVVLKEDNNKAEQTDKQEIESKPEPETKEERFQNGKEELPASTVEDKDQTVTKKYANEGKKESEDAKNDNAFETEFLDDSADNAEKKTSTTDAFDILLSISTLINPSPNKGSTPLVKIENKPNVRKLLQYNQYENEELDGDDGMESKTFEDIGDRMKRDEDPLGTTYPPLSHPPGVHNPNWKGPMPLYPEELTQTAKQVNKETYPNFNRVEIPIHSQDTAPETDDSEFFLTDVEYIEDYLDNGYEKLVNLAQAYSDYGVLDGKKFSERKDVAKNYPKLQNRKANRSVRAKSAKGDRNFWGRLKKGARKKNEGIIIQMHPTSESKENFIQPKGLLYKMLKSHIKVANNELNFDKQYNPLLQKSITTHLLGYHLNNQLETTKTYSIETNFPRTEKEKRQGKSKFTNNNNSAHKVTGFSEKYEVVKVKRGITDGIIQVETEKSTLNDKKDNILDNTKDNNNYDIVKKEIHAALNENEVSYTVDLKRDAESRKEGKVLQKEKIVGDKKEPANEVVDNPNGNIITKNDEMTFSDFFSLLSKWFNKMSHHDREDKVVNEAVVTTKSSSSEEPDDVKKRNVDAPTTPLLPQDVVMYNSGFKSRALLSVDSNNTEEEAKTDEEYSNDVSSSTEQMKSNLKNTGIKAKANNTISKRKVKRQAADNSNLVFWNDLYDDEYGIRVEPLENTIRDKHSAEKGDFIKKSNIWIHNKIKKMTNKLKRMPGRSNEDTQAITRRTRDTEDVKLEQNEENTKNTKIDFAALTAKMKEVCKKTAEIVQGTKKVHVRDEKEGEIADSLMQQLVRLMTDLVDFQVQERTCHSLPPDLKNFLEWLTASETQNNQDTEINNNNYKLPKRDVDNIEVVTYDKPQEEYLTVQTEATSLDTNTDCLGTLYAVEDLLKQYEAMSDDDKSVMSGVKDYLENQLNYLQRYLSSDDSKFYGEDESRYRRDLKQVGQKLAEAAELTTEIAKHQYKNMKKKIRKFYNKSLDKFKNKTKQTIKASQEKVISETKEILDKAKKPLTHCPPKVENKLKNKLHHKNIDKNKHCKSTNIIFKDENNIKDNIKSINNKESKLKTKSSNLKTNRDSINKVHRPSKSLERNIQDVYFKAVIDSKKVSTKSSQRRYVSDEKINDRNDDSKLR